MSNEVMAAVIAGLFAMTVKIVDIYLDLREAAKDAEAAREQEEEDLRKDMLCRLELVTRERDDAKEESDKWREKYYELRDKSNH